jgi:hypothetical protein
MPLHVFMFALVYVYYNVYPKPQEIHINVEYPLFLLPLLVCILIAYKVTKSQILLYLYTLIAKFHY